MEIFVHEILFMLFENVLKENNTNIMYKCANILRGIVYIIKIRRNIGGIVNESD